MAENPQLSFLTFLVCYFKKLEESAEENQYIWLALNIILWSNKQNQRICKKQLKKQNEKRFVVG